MGIDSPIPILSLETCQSQKDGSQASQNPSGSKTTSRSLIGSVDLYPDTKVHGANMGPIWGWQDPGGPRVGPIDLAIWVVYPLNMMATWLFPHYWPFVRGIHRSPVILGCRYLENYFRINFPLGRKSILYPGMPLTKASITKFWSYLCCQPEQAVEQTIKLRVIWMPWLLLMWHHYDDMQTVLFFVVVLCLYRRLWVDPCQLYTHALQGCFNGTEATVYDYKERHVFFRVPLPINDSQHVPAVSRHTVYPKKYAHGFVVLCFVVVMQSFIMNSH